MIRHTIAIGSQDQTQHRVTAWLSFRSQPRLGPPSTEHCAQVAPVLIGQMSLFDELAHRASQSNPAGKLCNPDALGSILNHGFALTADLP